MLHIANVIDQATVERIRAVIDQAEWHDGRATAGHLSAPVKRNAQLPEDSDAARQVGAIILAALESNPNFISAALPAKIVPPLFNRYGVGDAYGPHIDGSVRPIGGHERVRTDLSATLFLTAPDSYDGGELFIDDHGGVNQAKFAAGDLILYAASSVHHVAPVTRGIRTSAFFWVQSIVRDPIQRHMLFTLDQTIQALSEHATDEAVLSLTGHYHNLIRMWGDL